MNIGINGFGRVGKHICKAILFKYDSCYGVFPGEIEYDENSITINKKKINISTERDPSKIEWNEKIDTIIESTGFFTDATKASLHIRNNVKRVIITAPSKGVDITIIMGINEKDFDPIKHKTISNASCTTNSLAPAVKVLHDNFQIEKGFMTTVHAYTNDQKILDAPHDDLRRARAGAINIIPTTTGAAKAVSLVIPEMDGRITGIALRVPTPVVSITDFVCLVKKQTTKDEVNNAFFEASQKSLKGILGFTMEPIVSSDVKGNPFSGIIDGLSTMVLDGNFIKILSWYDNEWAFSVRIADLCKYISERTN
jgi:glyceraldehyde 3-phosphate dehydrogenase